MTTYFNPSSAIAFARFSGSSGSKGFAGYAVLTAQNLQARVQVSPNNMNVAVPPLQHSEIFGQCASSHTVVRCSCLSNVLRCAYFPVGGLIFSQSGFCSTDSIVPLFYVVIR